MSLISKRLNIARKGPPPSVILSGNLSIHPKPSQLYLVEVTEPAVVCTPMPDTGEGNDKAKIIIDTKDIIGCNCLKSKIQPDSNGYLAIYSYPPRRKLMWKKNVRRREVVTLTFSKYSNYIDNIEEAARWKRVLTTVIQQLSGSVQDTAIELQPPSRKLLVLINPFAGPGKAQRIFQDNVMPMLSEAGLHFSMVITERAGHAKDIVHNMKLDAWYAIVIVSGDGLIFEVINGLMSRPDWDRARLMPIGALPGGSGNALCCTINHHAGELFTENLVLHSTYVLVKHIISPMDLVAVDTCQGRVYSFLSITWGLIADIDIESERFRNLGNARFTVGAITRILGLRIYRGRLSFLPIEGETYRPRVTRPGPTRSQSVMNGFHSETPSLQPIRSNSMIVVPTSDSKSAGDVTLGNQSPYGLVQNGLPGNQTVPQSPQELEHAGYVYPWTVGTNNNTLDEQKVQHKTLGDDGLSLNVASLQGEANDALSPTGTSPKDSNNTDRIGKSMPYEAVPTPLLPPISEPVPDDWITIEDDFITVAAVFQSHLSTDFYAAPESKLADGLICLTFVRAPLSRSRLMQLLLAMEDGTYLTHEGQEMVRVKAFRLEPLQSNGNISVDGEAVDYGPIQAQILPSMLRVLAKKPD